MASSMPQIETVVFLMMENRSLDNLLGWLYHGRTPKHFYPDGDHAAYDGLVPGRYQNPARSLTGVHEYPVVPIPTKHQAQRVPAYDPYEAMREGSGWKGVMNQLFGNQDAIQGMPKKAPAHMLGFLQDYYARYMLEWQGLDVLWSYTPAQLPHINSLAYHYGVSDRWFSSVPTQTNPNRAYSICGTSAGREANANLHAVEQFDLPTVFDRLAEAGKSWGLYYEDVWQKGKCYTDYTFPRIARAPHGEIAPLARFEEHARAGTLPAFTYLEPKWGYGKGAVSIQGHDYHPPTLVAPGDRFLWDVYMALRDGPQWEKMLFIVTFDEHGGTYDHVSPPWTAINPDGIQGTRWRFDFELYGARVPTLLISPYIAPQTVFRAPRDSPHPFDHTSFISTLLLWAGLDDPAGWGLGKRVEAAPSFAGVLSDTPVNTGAETREPVRFDAFQAAGPDAPEETPPDQEAVNHLLEGIPFTSARAIIARSETLEDVHREIDTFAKDPDEFQSSLEGKASG
jgi:phospholipase C